MKRTDENHSFNVNVCQVIKGHIQKAILLKELYGWCHINKAKNHNVKFGLPWSYMSSAGFEEKFPYMSSSSIRRWTKELEEDGWIYSSVLNKKGFDKTKWYTINFERYDEAVLLNEHSIDQIEQWKDYIGQCIVQDGQPIPPTSTTTSTTSSSNNSVYKKDTQKNEIQDLKKEVAELKKQIQKKERKSSDKKKEKAGVHVFPDNTGRKTYNPKDKRENKQLPFSPATAKKTLEALYPTYLDVLKEYNAIFKNYGASKEIVEHCRTTFIETGISNYYPGIRDIVLLQRNFLEWIKKEVLYRRRTPKKETNTNSIILKQGFDAKAKNEALYGKAN